MSITMNAKQSNPNECEACGARYSDVDNNECEVCGEAGCTRHRLCRNCGHFRCAACQGTSHTCAHCGNEYCDCTESEWSVGADGITYCSQECAARSWEAA